MESDFTGSTNLDAVIGAIITADVVKKRSPKKNKAVPISSNDISGAVANLDLGGLKSGRDTSRSNQHLSDSQKKKKKTKIPLPTGSNLGPSSVLDSLSDYSRALLSSEQQQSQQSQQQNSARGISRAIVTPPVYHQPNLEVNIQDENDHEHYYHHNQNSQNHNGDITNSPNSNLYQQHSKPPLHQTNSTINTLTSFHNTNQNHGHHYQSYSSPSSRSILSNTSTSKFSTHSKQSNMSNTSNTSFPFSSSQQTVMTGSEIIATDKNLEPEQIQMLYEIDDITPDEQLRKRYEMNIRMADRVRIFFTFNILYLI